MKDTDGTSRPGGRSAVRSRHPADWYEPDRARSSGAEVAVFAPTPLVTVTIELGNEHPEVHFHAGGQGVWVARMAAGLGARVKLATVLGGESGQVLSVLLGSPGVEVHAVAIQQASGSYVHDRRRGARQSIAEMPAPRLHRHELDDLYGIALADGIASRTMCLTGPQRPEAIDPDVYERLAGDLRRNGTTVVADLTGPALDAALRGGVDVLKLSAEEMVAEGWASDGERPSLDAAVRDLHQAGARTVIASRGPEPALVLLDGRLLELGGLSFTPADPRGTGDSMVAAITVGVAEGRSLDDALRLGAAAGALNATRHGLGTGMRHQIEQLASRVGITDLESASGSGGP